MDTSKQMTPIIPSASEHFYASDTNHVLFNENFWVVGECSGFWRSNLIWSALSID